MSINLHFHRPIEFRGKVDHSSFYTPYPEVSGDYVFGLLMVVNDVAFIQTEADTVCGGSGGLTGLYLYPVHLDTISQFTGLFDSENNKIFEFDIVTNETSLQFLIQFKSGSFYAVETISLTSHLLGDFLEKSSFTKKIQH